ncbi:hypothetical protein F5884DRAFT_788462 [Xylogone sp. PMI_703]|nr:hypothetical protein F5884DRAFT_788462 [Xylogone sp. PMI_703]
MSLFCCICGLILATENSGFPQWCKDIRAICIWQKFPVLSDVGCLDDATTLFRLPIPRHGHELFTFRRYASRLESIENSCYPFHNACWALIQEIDTHNLLSNNTKSLFDVFESIHYDRNSRSFNWGHNYYLEDISAAASEDQRDYRKNLINSYSTESTVPADPLVFKFREENIQMCRLNYGTLQIGSIPHLRHRSIYAPICRGFALLPPEILQSILCQLDIDNVRSLWQTNTYFSKTYGSNIRDLPSSFWESRFWTFSETGFARALRPASCSWIDWFFIIKSELNQSINRSSLQNRKRIWKLGIDLVTLVQSIRDPKRGLYGDMKALSDRTHGLFASCLASCYDYEGCRELKQVYVPLESNFAESQLCALTPSYTLLSGRKLISGLTFSFSNSKHVNLGYVTDKRNGQIAPNLCYNPLRLIFSTAGLEAIFADYLPRLRDMSVSCSEDRLALAQWPLIRLKGVHLGLDAMRIVRICFETSDPTNLDDILWKFPCPSSSPIMEANDVASLRRLQRESFVPASTLCMRPSLTAIHVYSPLGTNSGITGIQLVHYAGSKQTWGSTYDAASMSFFVNKKEKIVQITVYKIGSLVCHLQLSTDLERTSDIFPPLSPDIDGSLKRVDYVVSNDEAIIGFSGCFAQSNCRGRLNCFGVLATTTARTTVTPSASPPPPSHTQLIYGLGNIRDHGEYQSRVLLKRNYRSVQACINPAASKYREAGQLTGLLFRSNDADLSYPTLLGQWTGGESEIYSLEDGEQIVNLELTTTKPRGPLPMRMGLSQVKSVAIVTNRVKVTWNNFGQVCKQAFTNISEDDHTVLEVVWVFNAIFDHVQIQKKGGE